MDTPIEILDDDEEISYDKMLYNTPKHSTVSKVGFVLVSKCITVSMGFKFNVQFTPFSLIIINKITLYTYR